MGLIVTVNSDDPPLFNTNLCREYEVLAHEFGYTPADLIRIARNAFMVCGVEATVKERLLARFEGWVAQ
jgi:aminodeoxyfutalosine deaminase